MFTHYYWDIALSLAIHKLARNCWVLTDIMSHLNNLCVKLQGVKHVIFI